MIRSVEDVLYDAGKPMTFEEIRAALPKRSEAGVQRALRAAIGMKHVRPASKGDGYEYRPAEER